MAETTSSFDIPNAWISLSSLTGKEAGTELVLQNTGHPGDIIEVAISELEPSSNYRGLHLDQVKSFYHVSAGLPEVWVKYMRADKGTTYNRRCPLQVTTPSTVGPYVKTAATQEGPLGTYVVNTVTETAAVTAALDGNVYTISGLFTLSGTDTAAVNFNLTESVILRRARVEGDGLASVEMVVYDQYATGAVDDTLSPVNVNPCSINTTTVTADLITNATANGNILDFGVGRIESPIAIGCEGSPLCVTVERRDNGGQEVVKWALSFEVLPEKPGQKPIPVILQPTTELTPTTEMSIYNG